MSITAYDFYQNVFQLKDKNLIQEFFDATQIRYMKKGEYIVRVGEVLNDVCFMENGITRGYFLDVNGKDDPNTAGRDVFSMDMKTDGTLSDYESGSNVPGSEGAPAERCGNGSTSSINAAAAGCLTRIIEDGWVMKY